ncbi:bifunctional adenosylcobinamide kinase/adenosylcobinamide-phosphate guanylyltransferase [Micromonospora okii]|uniref:bifunctional adenosylcobinamide kinase/adenosylcobinamide-phosphate guanylyltransferase n=1 Tax=Micromonospora okii TaxID=1182970 RepID=UPI001E65C722|nr:bifunctional adenosylcobinamide kinase/adenosylcobinamide-phosphate guanylyltransferase [Micromonospora okii]
MSVDGWNTLLVLGGIRSGKSEYAESLVADAPTVRYVATSATGDPEDAEWAARLEAHRSRRPGGWSTEETADDPRRLADVIASAGPNDTLLVDDLGGWVTVLLDPAHQPADDTATIAELAAAVRDCPARLVLVSPEVGLSLVPTTPLGRAFTDALGAANRAVADACDAVVLVVAGQPCWLKPTAAPAVATRDGHRPATAAPAEAVGAVPATATVVPATATVVPATATVVPAARPGARPNAPEPSATPWAMRPTGAAAPVFKSGMDLPMPDEHAGPRAVERLATLDLPGAGLGAMERVVAFAAATQGTPTPAPWDSVRVLLLRGDHAGAAAAGSVPGESARRAAQARSGRGVLARLAAEIGADLHVTEAPPSGPMEEGPALARETVEDALRYGWRLAGEAADAGVRLLVLASCSAGTDAAAAAVLAATAGAEPPVVLGRVVTPDGRIDDAAWMRRCAAVRDALHRTRNSTRNGKGVLAELGGGDIAVATGVLIGATARRLPVLLDGPVGLAAGMVSRELAGQVRHWCLLADQGGHPAVRLASDVLGLTPLLDLRLDLGEGANALTALPLLRSALSLAAALPPRPNGDDADTGDGDPLADGTGGGDTGAGEGAAGDAEPGDGSEFVEPEPAGPGPATTGADEPAEPEAAGRRAG